MGIFCRAALALSFVGLLPLPALAQAQAAASAASAAKTEAEAAMERAQRLAANPMRVILEASKFRRKAPVEVVEAVPEAADAASLRRTSARGEAASPAPAREEAVITPRSVPAPRPAAEPVNVLLTTTSTLSASTAAAAVPALEANGRVADTVPMAKTLAAPLATLAMPEEVPKLSKSVEPTIPPRLQTEAARLTEVLADLTIRPDGTVAGVVLASSVPRPLQQPITMALAQWVFEPLRNTRVHRVQLVFSDK